MVQSPAISATCHTFSLRIIQLPSSILVHSYPASANRLLSLSRNVPRIDHLAASDLQSTMRKKARLPRARTGHAQHEAEHCSAKFERPAKDGGAGDD